MHFHAVCPNRPGSCNLLITNPMDTYINVVHTHKDHSESCEQKTPRDFQLFCQRLPKRCEDRTCIHFEKEQGIAV